MMPKLTLPGCLDSVAKRGNRVNDIAFGAIQTPMADRSIGAAKKEHLQRTWLENLHPGGRISATEKATHAAIALLESSSITSAILSADGGFTTQQTKTRKPTTANHSTSTKFFYDL